MRQVFVVLLMAALLQPSPASAEEDTAPVLAEFSVLPDSMGYEGGRAVISVRVEDDHGVVAVTAFLHTYAHGTVEVVLEGGDVDENGVGTYEGSVDVPANYADEQVTHIVEASARDTAGAITSGTIGNITVDGQPAFDTPPTIGDPAVTPASLPASGGQVTVAVTAYDDRAISEVGGAVEAEAVPMQAISFDRFEGTWTAPANAGPDEVTHTIVITAYDDIGQSAYLTTTVTVAGQPQEPSKLVLSTRKLRFGHIAVGDRVVKELVLSNAGKSLPVSGSIDPLTVPFRLVGSRGKPMSFDLAPGGSMTLQVRYWPRRARLHEQLLEVSRIDGLQPRLSARLTGRGNRARD